MKLESGSEKPRQWNKLALGVDAVFLRDKISPLLSLSARLRCCHGEVSKDMIGPGCSPRRTNVATAIRKRQSGTFLFGLVLDSHSGLVLGERVLEGS